MATGTTLRDCKRVLEQAEKTLAELPTPQNAAQVRAAKLAVEAARKYDVADALPEPILVCDSQVDTDAAELANAYKTQGEAAARRLWAEKIKGLNYGQQIILQDKMAKLIKAKATDGVRDKNPKIARVQEELAELRKKIRTVGVTSMAAVPLKGKAQRLTMKLAGLGAEYGSGIDAARLHRALDAAMDARAKGRDGVELPVKQEIMVRKLWRAGRTSDEIASQLRLPVRTVRYVIDHMDD